MKRHVNKLLLVLLCLAGIHLLYRSTTEVGKRFRTEQEFVEYEESLGYLPLGKFDLVFPAMISSVKTATNEISFAHNGMAHTYPGYQGRLKVVKLQTVEGNAVYVLIAPQKMNEQRNVDHDRAGN